MKRTRRIGRYHLTGRVASGGMAEVYRAFTFGPDGMRHDVAVKRLLPHYVADEAFVTMLVDEYRIVSRIDHANVARVFELAEVEDELLIAMEYVDGKDMRTTAERAMNVGSPLSLADSAYLLARALEGLHEAHEARDEQGRRLGVVHRDMSPSNVLVGYNGDVKICDFGIAKARSSRTRTRAGVIKGKVKYMSPEQAMGSRLDQRSDVFSAGTMLYELCTGSSPFVADNEIDLIFAVRDADPPNPRHINGAIPEDLARILRRAMAKERKDRYASALDFRDALEGFLERNAPEYRRSSLARFMKHLWKR
ncbi:MAG: serine/threonine-protein kinase, partial [Myxococcota bacterium]